MTPREEGFLLLTSQLGDPERKPLTTYQLRTLSARVRGSCMPEADREMEISDLVALGYSSQAAKRILDLLSDRELLEYYLYKGRRAGCVPVTRVSPPYPQRLHRCLGEDSPGCLWLKGDASLLKNRCVALVGSRDLERENFLFAREAGIRAAEQGYTLVSGNARGSDKAAQEACLFAGGNVISVVADQLDKHALRDRILFISEDSFDAPFTTQRALSRNRVIHSLSGLVLVAQCGLGAGGTWNGTSMNLRNRWSNVCCFDDGSESVEALCQMGALRVGFHDLKDLEKLEKNTVSFFDRV